MSKLTKYTRIKNTILESLAKIRISGEARQVLDVIIRKTFGYRKVWDRISLSQLSLYTGLKRPTVARGVSKLITLNLIIIKKDNSNNSIYCVNGNFDTWKPLSKKITVIKKDNRGGIKKDNRVLSKKIHTKETITKETIKQKKERLSLFFESFWKEYPCNKEGRKNGKKETLEWLHQKTCPIKEKEHSFIIKAVKQYAKSDVWKKDPVRFLKKDFWKGWVDQSQQDKEWEKFRKLTGGKENDT